jgi:hypothetical protein
MSRVRMALPQRILFKFSLGVQGISHGAREAGIKGCTKGKNEISAPRIFISKGISVIAVLGSLFPEGDPEDGFGG